MPQVKAGNSNTKIVVLPPSAFEARGYSAKIHPEGYVYFEKNEETPESEMLQPNDGEENVTPENAMYWQQRNETEENYNLNENSGTFETSQNQQHQYDSHSRNIYDNTTESYAPQEHTYFVNVKNEIPHDNVNNEEGNYEYEEEEQGEMNAYQNPPDLNNSSIDYQYSAENEESVNINIESQDSHVNQQDKGIFKLFSQNPAKETIRIETELDNERYTRKKITYTFATGNTSRKLHKSYANGWLQDINNQGFARCLISTCNFLSLSLLDMQMHYKYCDGVPSYLENCCTSCNGRFPTADQLEIHFPTCKGKGKPVLERYKEVVSRNAAQVDVRNNFRFQTNQRQSFENGDYAGRGASNLGVNQKLACGTCKRKFTLKDDLDKHHVECLGNKYKKRDINKKNEILHFKDIQKLRDGCGADLDKIVQPGPVLPQGHYLRRRGYTKQHKQSWLAALERNNYVKCIFQNCYFLAMSLEDMISHFGYCSGDGSFAKFVCQYCQGRVTSQNILDIHIQRSHLKEHEANICKARIIVSKSKDKGKIYKISEVRNVPVEQRAQVKVEQPNPPLYLYCPVNVTEPECTLTENALEDLDDTLLEPSITEVKENLIKSPDRKVAKVVRTYQRKSKNKSKINEMIEKALKDVRVSNKGSPKRGERSENEINLPVVAKKEIIMANEGDGDEYEGVTQNEAVHEEITPDLGMGMTDVRSISTFDSFENVEQPLENQIEQQCDMNASYMQEMITQEDRMQTEPECNDNLMGVNEELPTYEQGQERNDEEEMPIEEMNSLAITQIERIGDIDPLCTDNYRPEEGENLSENQIPEYENVQAEDTMERGEVNMASYEINKMHLHSPNREVMNEGNEENFNEFNIPYVQDFPGSTEEEPKSKITKRRGRRKKIETPAVVEEQAQESLMQVNHDKSFELETVTRSTRSKRKTEVEISKEPLINEEVPKKRGRKKKEVKEFNVDTDQPEEASKEMKINLVPVAKLRSKRKGRLISDDSDDVPLENLKTGKMHEEDPKPAKDDKNKQSKDKYQIKCAKCDFKGTIKKFEDHNIKKHVGLSWAEGEEPFDVTNVPLLESTVKKAFKFIKSVECENCHAVKKSAVGFASHVQSCGKSKEEIEALKVECELCGAKISRYSLPVHMKLSHPNPLNEDYCMSEAPVEEEIPENLSGKRRSAVRASKKFQQVFTEVDEYDADVTAEVISSSLYAFYEKGVSKFPKMPKKIILLWNKMKREGRKIPCRRAQCFFESETTQEARKHHFMCPELPDKVYVCEGCDFYSENEVDIERHAETHLEPVEKDFAYTCTAEDMEEAEGDREMEIDEPVEELEEGDRTEQPMGVSRVLSSEEAAIEMDLKKSFMLRENILYSKSNQLFHQTLDMTLKAEKEDFEDLPLWPELRTAASDWVALNNDEAKDYLPNLSESVSIHLSHEKAQGLEWRVFQRFESDIVSNAPVLFAGGSVRAMSWCRVAANRMVNKNIKQYLAVAAEQKMDCNRDIREQAAFPGLIQIWDFGVLENTRTENVPKMVLGITHNSGEVTDMTWLPADLFLEETKEHQARLGLLGASFQDGTVRIWSICDPSHLVNNHQSPIFKIHPSVILKPLNESDVCLKFDISKTGSIVAGYSSGTICIWNLQCISSPFTKKEGKSYVLKPINSFIGHKSAITALKMSQLNGRYFSTGAYDRDIKLWDTQYAIYPTDLYHKETALDIVMPRNWPISCFCYEDVVFGAPKVAFKAIKDIVFENVRTAFTTDSIVWSLSFNDWLNTLVGCSNSGEIKLRFFRNVLLADGKAAFKSEAVWSTTEVRPLENVSQKKGDDTSDGKEKGKSKDKSLNVPRSYDEAKSSYGVVITDYTVDVSCKKEKSAKTKLLLEEYPIKSATKVCFNPNFGSFTHLAVGYHCGLVRLITLDKLQKDSHLVRFFKKEAF